MADVREHVGEDREGKSLHEFGKLCNELIGAYVDENPGASMFYIGCDKEGYVFGSAGNNGTMIADALLEAADKDPIVEEAMKQLFNNFLQIVMTKN